MAMHMDNGNGQREGRKIQAVATEIETDFEQNISLKK